MHRPSKRSNASSKLVVNLWVMLDQVPTEQVRPLLSGRQLCETVDETELTDFVVEMVSSTSVLAEEDRTVRVSTP